jgi:formamidase
MRSNRWHPDIPMVAWVEPGDDFIIETYDWTGGFIKNNDSADDVRDIDLSIVHFLSGPVGVKGAEPGDLLVVDLLDADRRHPERDDVDELLEKGTRMLPTP